MNGENIVFFITGQTGAGKTTTAKSLSSKGIPALHTGEQIKNAGLLNVDAENPVAPEEYDQVVYGAVDAFLHDGRNVADMVGLSISCVETFPRAPRHVPEMVEMVEEHGVYPIILVLEASTRSRISRVVTREMASVRKTLDERKINDEDNNGELALMIDLIKSSYPWSVIRIDTTFSLASPVMYHDELNHLEHMFHLANQCYRNIAGDQPTIDKLPRLLLRCQQELAEADRAITGKEGNVIDELVDAMHFLLTAFSSLGMSPESIYKAFLNKSAINHVRQLGGVKIDGGVMYEEGRHEFIQGTAYGDPGTDLRDS